jgi:hypothetical protein
VLRAFLLVGLLVAPLGACGKHAATEPTPGAATPVVGSAGSAAPAGAAAMPAGSAAAPAGSGAAPAGSAAAPAGSGDPAALCASTGGSIGNASCCGAVGDFPDMTGVGACGCAPNNSHTVKICDCPAGKRFSATAGCQ